MTDEEALPLQDRSPLGSFALFAERVSKVEKEIEKTVTTRSLHAEWEPLLLNNIIQFNIYSKK